MDVTGVDTDGKQYSSPDEMWLQEAAELSVETSTNMATDNLKKEEWYQKGVHYWEGVEASVEGVLGGYGHLNDRDVVDSTLFLKDAFHAPLAEAAAGRRHLVALDCGAGIGRVTRNFLLRHFHEVDLVEPVQHFLDEARVSLGGSVNGKGATKVDKGAHRAVNFFCTPLQEFTPAPGRYDVIWVQWCIGHLTDADFIKFFQRCKVGLKPDGIIVVKENNAKDGFVLDKEDSSVTRSHSYFCDLFSRTGYHLHRHVLQRRFPKDLFQVRMYCLTQNSTPSTTGIETRSRAPPNQPGKIS